MRILKPTTPRKIYIPHRYLAIEASAKMSRNHVGLYHWCAYWRQWDKIISVDGNWVTVQEVDLKGNPVGETRRHCTQMAPAMFADFPFQPTFD